MTYDEYTSLVNYVFAALARMYGWTYSAMEEMTPQQLIMVAVEALQSNEAKDDGMLHFTTVEELKLWRQAQGFHNG